jgi:hypothetical protein
VKKELPPNFRTGKVSQVVEVEVLEGLGTEDNPKRTVTYFLDCEGHLLAKGINEYAYVLARVIDLTRVLTGLRNFSHNHLEADSEKMKDALKHINRTCIAQVGE